MSSNAFDVSDIADDHIDDIFRYTREHWGEPQARRYIEGLYRCFEDVAARSVAWQPIEAALGSGYVRRYRHHRIYWKIQAGGRVVFVAVLHESMHPAGRLKQAFTDDA